MAQIEMNPNENRRDLAFALFIALVLSFAFFMSCKTIAPIVVTDTTNQTETKKETTDKTMFAPDSLKLRLLFECDSNNNVLIRENSELKTKGFNTVYQFQNNTLDLTIFTDSIEQLNRLLETTKSKETIVHSPLDEVIQAENESLKKEKEKNKQDIDRLKQKATNKNKLIGGLIAFIVICGAILKLIKK